METRVKTSHLAVCKFLYSNDMGVPRSFHSAGLGRGIIQKQRDVVFTLAKLLAAIVLLAAFGDLTSLAKESPAPKVGKVELAKVAAAGLNAFSKNDLETAGKEFRHLLELDPDNLTGLVNLGTVEYRKKNLDESERLLKKAVRLQPEAPLAWWTLGVIYCEQEKLDAALAALSQAVYLDPKNANAHNYLAVVVGKKGWNDAAEQEFLKAIELAPDSADAHFNLALLYIQRDPPAIELARRHYQKALDLGAAGDPTIEKALSKTTVP